MLPADGAVEGAAEGPVISEEQHMIVRRERCVVWVVVARGCVEFVAVPAVAATGAARARVAAAVKSSSH